jgi:PiT family inorganic phosphate transporter
MWQLSSGVFLGWALGANDASNVFGTAVASRMVRYRTAVVLCALFIVLGAWWGGGEGMLTYQALGRTGLATAFLVGLASALTVAAMTLLALPVSTSQAVVGALVAVAATSHKVDWTLLGKVVVCWVGTPVGAAMMALVLYPVLATLFNRLDLNLFQYDVVMRLSLVAAGAYGAYALGANNVANVTGPFVGDGMLSVSGACWWGGLSIAFGVLTFSRRVMTTVGRGLVPLDAFSALVVVLAESMTVHGYAVVGVPVSTSQAVVGAVLGIGLIKGHRTVNRRVLGRIGAGWLATPVVSALLTWGWLAFWR